MCDTGVDFEHNALRVLKRLLKIEQITIQQYQKIIDIFAIIKSHPSDMSTEAELTTLFTFASLKNVEVNDMYKESLVLYGIEDDDTQTLFFVVNFFMNRMDDEEHSAQVTYHGLYFRLMELDDGEIDSYN